MLQWYDHKASNSFLFLLINYTSHIYFFTADLLYNQYILTKISNCSQPINFVNISSWRVFIFTWLSQRAINLLRASESCSFAKLFASRFYAHRVGGCIFLGFVSQHFNALLTFNTFGWTCINHVDLCGLKIIWLMMINIFGQLNSLY